MDGKVKQIDYAATPYKSGCPLKGLSLTSKNIFIVHQPSDVVEGI